MPARKTTEQFITEAKSIHGDTYDYSHVIYKNANTPVEIICRKHGPFLQRPAEHLDGNGCQQCGIESRSRKNKVPFDVFVERAREIHGDKYDYSQAEKEYKDLHSSKVTIICPRHGAFLQIPNNHIGKQQQGCPECGRLTVIEKNRMTMNEFLLRARQAHGWKYDYSKVDLKAPDRMITIVCPVHGEFRQNIHNHISAGQGCPKCAKEHLMTGHFDSFVKKSKEKFGDQFDYSKVVYGKTMPGRRVTIICREHGPFNTAPQVHLRSTFGGCKGCDLKRRTEEFMTKARLIHGDKYDYSHVRYRSTYDKVEIICPQHGPFLQAPNEHLQGKGCRLCAIEYRAGLLKVPFEEFVRKTTEACGPTLDLTDSKTSYEGLTKDVTVRCTRHGFFTKKAQSLTLGYGCPACSVENRSFILRMLADEEFLLSVPSNSLLEIIGKKKYLPKAFFDIVYTQDRTEARAGAIRRLREFVTLEKGIELPESQIDDQCLETLPESDTLREPRDGSALESITALGRQKNLQVKITRFIREEYLQGLWNDVLNGTADPETIEIVPGANGISEKLLSDFLTEYAAVKALDIDPAYRFPAKPTLLQKLIVKRSLENRCYANWSAMGTGKTLSALLTARLSGSYVMLVLAPKDVLIHSWVEQIRSAYPDTVIHTNIFEIKPEENVRHFNSNKKPEPIRGRLNCILVNYDKFSSLSGYDELRQTLLNACPDFVCLDEIQYVKTTTGVEPSNRHIFTADFLKRLRKKNPLLRVHVLSGTPVVNDLQEPRSILSLLTGEQKTGTNRITVRNVHDAYGDILTNGFRYRGNPTEKVRVSFPEIDGTDIMRDIALIDLKDGILEMERMLTLKKISCPEFKDAVRPGTIVYTSYVSGIIEPVLNAVRKLGMSTEAYTGDTEDRNGVYNRFVSCKTDVLVASRPLMLGIDGLQERSDNLVILSLPWTWADYQQLIARINRPVKGNLKRQISVIIPQVIIRKKGYKWSWDHRRYALIKNKRTLGEAILDGYIEKIYSIDRNLILKDAIETLNDETKIKTRRA